MGRHEGTVVVIGRDIWWFQGVRKSASLRRVSGTRGLMIIIRIFLWHTQQIQLCQYIPYFISALLSIMLGGRGATFVRKCQYDTAILPMPS